MNRFNSVVFKKERNKALFTIAIVLMLTTSMLMFAFPVVEAKSNATLSTYLYPIIGVNSATLISWMPNPNMLLNDPQYVNKTSVWSNAVVTFTRPDGTTDVIKGPFKARNPIPGGATRRDVVLIYTPNMKGTWTVNFTWPGDDNYNSVSRVDTFPVGDAHPKRNMYAMLSLRPFPTVGLNQQCLITAWITPPPITARDTYEDLTFTVKKPDGTTAVTFSTESEAPGTAWFEWYFDQVGNWTVTFSWPGDFISKPCSVTQTITVNQNMIQYPVQDTPTPKDFWSFPINVFNREWRNVAGPWYQQYYNASRGSMNPYTEAPKSAHILWEIPPVAGEGGFMGAEDHYKGIETTGTYTATAASIRTVLAGRGYYTALGNITCVDMTNGQVLWTRPGSFNVGANRSRTPALYYFATNTFTVFDALTGAVTLNTTGMPMTLFDEPYVLTLSNDTLTKWTTDGSTTNFASRVIWNASLSKYWGVYNLNANWWYVLHNGVFAMRLSKYLAGLGSSPGISSTYESVIVHKIIGYDFATGKQIYDADIVDPTNPDTWWLQQGPCTGAANGLFYFTITGRPEQMNPPKTAGGYVAFDIATGQRKWLSEPFNYPWGNFFAYMPMSSGYGYIFSIGYDGIYALDVNTGKIAWHYTPGNAGMETPYNSWTFGSTGPVVGGGVIFAPETEHSPTLYYRGNSLKAVDAYTGKEVWDIMGYYTPTAIAYATLLATDTPSGYTYAFAKGQTETTVSVQNDVYTRGNSVLIKGTVTDQSPAQKGTPAISDASMTAWMEYIHMQQLKPTNATGVKVKLSAIDPNGNYQDIGTTTSSAEGNYGMMWTPPVTGVYRITATFEGSESYYPSTAETMVGVEAATTVNPSPEAPSPTAPITIAPSQSVAPTATATPTQAPPPATGSPDISILVLEAAVVIIIAIVVAAVVLKKRK